MGRLSRQIRWTASARVRGGLRPVGPHEGRRGDEGSTVVPDRFWNGPQRTVAASATTESNSVDMDARFAQQSSDGRPAASRRGAARATPSGFEGRLLSAQDAARYLGVPYTSLRDWALRGHMPIVRVPGCRRLWFDRRDLDRAIEAWKERA